MRRLTIPIVLVTALFLGCAAHHKPTRATLADLHNVHPDVQEVRVDQGLDQAMQSYRRFLEETPETAMTPEAMRRLADLQIEKQFGIHTGDLKPPAIPAPKAAQALAATQAHSSDQAAPGERSGARESDREFERRTTVESPILPSSDADPSLSGMVGGDAAPKGPAEAIALYKKLLTEYPSYKNS